MLIKSIDIQNLRNIKKLTFEAAKSINFISGPNGAGKSSILEAIYLLSSGRSFRTHLSNELISDNADQLIVRAGFYGSTSTLHNAGLLKNKNEGMRIRLDQSDLKSTAELARILPVTVIHPDMHEIVKGGPSIRRKFIDWGVFHVEPSFHSLWKRYQGALTQRNNLLKGAFTKSELGAWTNELSTAGVTLNQSREIYLEQLGPIFKKWCDTFELGNTLSLIYKQGWDKNLTLQTSLENATNNCIRYKTTTVGPHRADIIIKYGNHHARKVVSRGQQKLLIYALVFSQIELLRQSTKNTAVLLCDDPEAELDSQHRNIIIDSVKDLDVQCFLTGNSKSTWDATISKCDKVFHVERGELIQH